MDNGYFMNAGIPPPPQQLDTIPWNFTMADQLIAHHHSSLDQYSHYESALSSMVSSPVSAAAQSNDPFLLRELIGKLGGGDHHHHPFALHDTTRGNNNNYSSSNHNNNNIPLSPPKLLQQLPPIPHQKHSLSPSLGKPVALTPPQLGDPGFAERAAKFSCFGSRSFNGRTSPLVELPNRSKVLMDTAKLPRVSSSPSLKQSGSAFENRTETGTPDKKLSKLSGSGTNSNEESSVSEQIPSGNNSNEMSSRKRKGVSRAKPKEDGSNQVKGGGGSDDDGNAKRWKATENEKNENGEKKPEDEVKGGASDENEKQKANQKPPEPPKDYIHVRARRGQATDSHSLAERVRREKISERMKLLQDLVPGCNKVTGKALMLDEIINYVQSLQRQVEFLSMKLASVNPELDFNMDNLHSKDMFQPKATLPQQMYPLDSSAPALYQQNVQQQLHSSTNISRGPLSQCTVDPHPLPLGTQLPSLDGFTEGFTQFPSFSEDDLHSIVGFAHNHVNFPVLNQTSNAKVEQ